jgi:hypothetical protein
MTCINKRALPVNINQAIFSLLLSGPLRAWTLPVGESG